MADRNFALRIETAGVEAAEAGFHKIGEAGAAAGRAVASGFRSANDNLESAAGKLPGLYDKVAEAAKGAAEHTGGGASALLKWAAAGSVVALAGVGVYEIFSKIRGEAVELSKQSLKTAVDVETLQKILFAGGTQGVSEKDLTSSLAESAKKLNEIRHGGEEELTKFLDANNIKYRDRNGQLIQANQLLLAGADLIARAATYQDKVKAVGILGLSEETIPLLERGRAGIEKLMEEAQRAGAVRSKELIDADAEVARKWNETTTRWATTLKGAVLDVADYFRDTLKPAADDALANLNRLTQGLTGEQLRSLAQQKARPLLEALGVDFSQIETDPEVARRLNPDTATLDARARARDREMVDQLNARRAAREAAAKPPSGSLAFPKAEEEDASPHYDRVTEAIKRRRDEYAAEAGAVGLSTEAKVRGKAAADLFAAARRDEVELTGEETRKILELAAAEGRAAQAAKDAEQRWRGITDAVQFGGNQLISVLDKVGERGARLSDIFRSVEQAIRHALLQAALLGQGPFAGILGLQAVPGTGAPGGVLGSALSSLGPGPPSLAFDLGGIMTRYGALPLHRYDAGGVADRPQLALFGERGRKRPEAYVPLPDGRSIPVSISTAGAHIAPAAPSSGNVYVHNYGSTEVSAQRQPNPAGGMDWHLTVRNIMRGELQDDVMNGGPISQAYAHRFGLNGAAGLAR